ncbi:MAG: hypothetical protein WEB57_03305 [Pseudohongiellaceae bacterium]
MVGFLFLLLATVSAAIAVLTGLLGAAIPLVVFATVSFVCLVVGKLGSDRAVARVWGNR